MSGDRAGSIGLEGAVERHSSVAAQRERSRSGGIILQDAGKALAHGEIQGNCGGVYGDHRAVGNNNIICGGGYEPA